MPHEDVSAYYSAELKSWVRMVRECDGEYCHTSGYESYIHAMTCNGRLPWGATKQPEPENVTS
jgi:hypothetical protein